MAVSKFWIVVRTMSSCDTAGDVVAGQQHRAEDGDGGQRGDDQDQRDHPAPAAPAAPAAWVRRRGPESLAAQQFSASIGCGAGAGARPRRDDLGGRVRARLDDLGRARVETRRRGEPASRAAVGRPAAAPARRGRDRLPRSRVRIRRRRVRPARSFSSVPDGFDIRASVLPRDYCRSLSTSRGRPKPDAPRRGSARHNGRHDADG